MLCFSFCFLSLLFKVVLVLFMCVYGMCIYSNNFVCIYLILYLPFVWDFHFVSCFSVFALILFNAITNHQWNFISQARDWTLKLWSGSTDNKTLNCQKTPNPKEY